MSADGRAQFVDANVLVYAFDATAGQKRVVAARLLENLWRDDGGRLSVQVLQEFFVAITRKVPHPLPAAEAAERVREFSAWRVFTPTAGDVLAAISLHREAQLAFWDAMIVHAASESGCDVLWTEDLADGPVFGGVRIINPFVTG